MKAAILAVCDARFIDISHEIPPFDVKAASFVLWAGTQNFPAGTIHLAVVDPGVGGVRRPLAIQADGNYFVGPDNGIFSLVVRRARHLAAVELPRPASVSATFEGRDIFAPAVGSLGRGQALVELGRRVEDLVELRDPGPSVVWVDNFGNLVTNIPPPVGRLRVGQTVVEVSARTYAEAPPGVPFWYAGSLGLVEIGVRQGRADEVLKAGVGTPIEELPGA
ncbi:MAG: SAM-dependent chlorinase/fluorinase [Candidatus Dormibacteraeota bacterium]|nr:SAM-dependent chlorinase/fluorinase [Candidatus Dormibacteraeota bacterium]